MGSGMTLALRSLAATAAATAVLVVADPAVAVTAPETMADRRPVQAGPVAPGFPIDHVGVMWDGDAHADGHDATGRPAVRFLRDGTWGPWTALVEDGAESPGTWASGLVAGDDADAYQVRGVPGGALRARAVAINTTDGRPIEVGRRPGGAAGALDSARCRSRAEWGADEALRTTSGKESWPATFTPAQALTVHHTATSSEGDPAAAMRAIYRYHAVDRAYGDIGYQYVVAPDGVVYEGRWSGAASRSCAGGGDGSDFGHEDGDVDRDGRTGEMVVGAHVGGWNSGNIGAAVLGDFTTAAPSSTALATLQDLLAELAARHRMDPEARIEFVNPANGARKVVDTISGHRDWVATECPGGTLHATLPSIRDGVAARMAATTTTTTAAPTTTTTPAAQPTVTATDRGTANPLRLGTGQTMVVRGTGLAKATSVSFVNGQGTAPKVTRIAVDADDRVTATVSVPTKASTTAWDVRVTTSDGRTASCRACAQVQR